MATLTVGSVAGAMFSNLEAAVGAAEPGDTIRLQGGEVRLEAPGATADGRVRIDESITIVGQGATVSRLVSVADARSPLLADAVFPAISVDGGAHVAFANFTLDGQGHMLSAGFSV